MRFCHVASLLLSLAKPIRIYTLRKEAIVSAAASLLLCSTTKPDAYTLHIQVHTFRICAAAANGLQVYYFKEINTKKKSNINIALMHNKYINGNYACLICLCQDNIIYTVERRRRPRKRGALLHARDYEIKLKDIARMCANIFVNNILNHFLLQLKYTNEKCTLFYT